MGENKRLSTHFFAEEYACKCAKARAGEDCGAVAPAPLLVEKVEALREAWHHALVITSGSRCQTHNATVGGRPHSQHLVGKAVDLRVKDRAEGIALAAQAEQVGFRGIGVANNFVHVDVRAGRRARWEYK